MSRNATTPWNHTPASRCLFRVYNISAVASPKKGSSSHGVSTSRPAMGTEAINVTAYTTTKSRPSETVISELDAQRWIQSVFGPSAPLTCSAAISAAPTALMNAIRTDVRRRPGLGLSSSVSSCCNQTASAYNCRNAAGARHSERGAEKTYSSVSVPRYPWMVTTQYCSVQI